MKIAIVAPSPVPFTIGGAELLVQGMQNAIKKYTHHQCELIKIPVNEDNFWNLIESYKFFFHLDLSHFDMVISTKYPSWMIQHRNHRVYLIHHLRGLFDTYHFCHEPERVPKTLRTGLVNDIVTIAEKDDPTQEDVIELFEKLSRLKDNQHAYDSTTFKFPGPLIREIIQFLDKFALAPERIKQYFTMSENVRKRKNYFPDISRVKIINPPSSLNSFQCRDYKNLFTASRLDSPKRIDLLIKAMKHVPHPVKLIIAGEGPEENQLKEVAKGDKRIEFLGFVPENYLEELYSEALVVLFVPYDEDYGIITIEGMMSRKPVISAFDSGGPLEFIVNGKTGYIVDPDPQKIAEKINYFIENRDDAVRLGNTAFERVKDISWERFTSELLDDSAIVSHPRKKILVLSTYSCFPPRGGGQHRLYNIYSRLAKEYDITICSIIESNKKYQEYVLENSLKQICIPQSREHAEEQWNLERQTRKSLFDISMIENIEKTDEYVQKIKKLSSESCCIIFSHPYLINLKKFIDPGKKIVYDSIDTEYLQKKGYISDKKILDKVFFIEQQACTTSDMIWTTSENECKNIADLYHISPDKIFIIPNGTDTSFITYTTHEEKLEAKKNAGISQFPTVLFIGSWHPPNLEALKFIIEKLAKNLKNIKFLIIGSIKDNYLQEKGTFPDNVLAFGSVDEIEKTELFKLADIAINPMFGGSGTNLKILDYMSAGIPVISSVTGARGLEISNNIDAIICEPEQFACEIERLLNNINRQELLRYNARKKAEENFSWDSVAKKVSDSLKMQEKVS